MSVPPGTAPEAVLLHTRDTRGEHTLQLNAPQSFGLLARPCEAVAMGKALFYPQPEMSVAAADPLAGESMACNLAPAVAQDGVQAFIEKRKPQWPV